MAKRKKTPKRSQNAKSTPVPRGFGRKNFDVELRKAEASMVKEDWGKAYQTLQRLGEDYPDRQIIWEYLAEVCIEMENLSRFQYACEQWLKLDPNNIYLLYNLGRTYLSRHHPLLALQTFRRSLELDPNHEYADETKSIVKELETAAPDLLAEIDLPESQAWEIAILHERGQAYLEEGQMAQARDAELTALEKYPQLLSAQNNLSLIAYMDGNLEEALNWSQTVLDQDLNNIHALSNLVRFHVTAGKIDQAQTYVEPLLASQADAWDGWTKKAEALSYLADDAGVIELYEQAKESNDQPSTGLFYHLVAVAYAQTGQDKVAKKLWRQALELDPQMAIAQDNLDDLLLPEGKRHGAWPMELMNWLSPQASKDLQQWMESVTTHKKSAAIAPTLHDYFNRHPEVLTLLPTILERGGPSCQEFVANMAEGTQLPELLDVVKDFALGQQGNEQIRYQMARVAAQAGLLPKDNVKLWLQGEWHEVMLTNYQISDEPSISHSKKVASLLQKAIPLIKSKYDFDAIEQGKRYLEQALKLEPDSPDLLNNLAMAYLQLGQNEKSRSTLEEVSKRFPDYVFTATALAHQKIDEQDIPAAEALLKPCATREKFHYEEFAAFADAQIAIAMAKKERKQLQSWLNIWEQVDSEHPKLFYWQDRLKQQVFFY